MNVPVIAGSPHDPPAWDFDGDGIDDVVYSTIFDDPSDRISARIEVYSGATKFLLYQVLSSEPFDSLGFSVASVGDIDADGFNDLLVGAPGSSQGGPASGRIHLVSGFDGSIVTTLLGQPEERLGWAVGGAGDVDGDGVLDYLASKITRTAQGPIGGVHVYSGASAQLKRTFISSSVGDGFGFSVTGVGDLDGDGRSEIAIAAPLADAGDGRTGKVYIFRGQPDTIQTTFYADQADAVLTAATFELGRFGVGVFAGSDQNSDGIGEIVVVSSLFDAPEGKRFLYESFSLVGEKLAEARIEYSKPKGDADSNLKVELPDLGMVMSQFGGGSTAGPFGADLNDDGIVDGADLQMVLGSFGTIAPALQIIRQPGAGIWDSPKTDLRCIWVGIYGHGFGANWNCDCMFGQAWDEVKGPIGGGGGDDDCDGDDKDPDDIDSDGNGIPDYCDPESPEYDPKNHDCRGLYGTGCLDDEDCDGIPDDEDCDKGNGSGCACDDDDGDGIRNQDDCDSDCYGASPACCAAEVSISGCPTPDPLFEGDSPTPKLIYLDRDPNVQKRYTFSASGSPGGGTYTWSVGGSSGAWIEGPTVGTSAVVLVSSPGSVIVRVRYSTTIGADQCAAYDVCEFYAVRASLKSVTFGDSHLIKPDPGSGVQNFDAPEWLDENEDGDGLDQPNDHMYPVAYTRGTRLTVSELNVKFEGQIPPGAQARVKGEVSPGGFRLEGDATVNGGRLLAHNLQANTAFPDTVYVYTPMLVIFWSIGLEDANGTVTEWKAVGMSWNKVYLTLGDPEGDRFETYYHIGCRGASGATDETSTFLGLWSPFASRQVMTVGGQQLQYYTSDCNTDTSAIFTAAELLEHSMGRCGAWQDLFIAVTKTQGIAGASARNIIPNSVTLPVRCAGAPICSYSTDWIWMMINNYTFGTPSDPCGDYPHRVNHACAAIGAKWPQPDTADANGVPGQNNANPPGMFLDHAIVEYGGKLYDPSYGTGPFADLVAYEAASIAGFAIPQQFNPGIPGTQLGCYFRCRQNTAVSELKDR